MIEGMGLYAAFRFLRCLFPWLVDLWRLLGLIVGMLEVWQKFEVRAR